MIFDRHIQTDQTPNTEVLSTVTEEKLFNSLMLFRLNKDLELNASALKNNEPTDVTAKKGVKKLWNRKVVNKLKRNRSSRLSVERKNILDQIEAFKANTTDFYDMWISDVDVLKAVINKELFANDTLGMARNMFALRFALDKTYKFVNENESLEAVSSVLFGDCTHITKLLNSFVEHYAEISNEQFSSVTKGIMIGLSIASAAATLLVPASFAIGTSVSANVTQILATFAHQAPKVVLPGIAKFTAITLLESVVVCAVGKATCVAMDKVARQSRREEARKMSISDFNVVFAIKATLIEFAKNSVSEDLFKEAVSDCLLTLDDLRSDAEYMLIVEKLDAPSARKKIKSCNKLMESLASIVGI